MKRVFSLFTAILICVAAICPAYAANDFVPSIDYKPCPDIDPIIDPNGREAIAVILDENGQIVEYIYDCLVVTPVAEANTSTVIPADSKEILLDVYDKLSDGSMQLPYEKYNSGLTQQGMVIRDLFDASWLCDEHPVLVAQDGVTVQITFKLGVSDSTKVYCMNYVDGEWNPIVKCENIGNGKVSCVFEELCPIVFCVEQPYEPPVQTGDAVGKQLPIWFGVLAVSAVSLVVLLIAGNKKKR